MVRWLALAPLALLLGAPSSPAAVTFPIDLEGTVCVDQYGYCVPFAWRLKADGTFSDADTGFGDWVYNANGTLLLRYDNDTITRLLGRRAGRCVDGIWRNQAGPVLTGTWDGCVP